MCILSLFLYNDLYCNYIIMIMIIFLVSRDMIRQCFPLFSISSVQCYELLCMHIGVVSNRFVATSCKKLSALLWEASGEASSPIGLL